MSILVSDWLVFHADRTPNKVAMIDQATGRAFTYAEMNERTTRLASFMHDQWSITKGDRVAILAKNSVQYFEFQYACFKLGAMMLPLNWRLAEPELLFILNDAQAVGIVYDNDFAERIPPLMEQTDLRYRLRLDFGEPRKDDAPAYEDAIRTTKPHIMMSPTTNHDTPCTIMYTSGTTGRPKGAIITQGMTLWNAINISVPTGLGMDSVFYCILPTFHTGGLNLYVNPLVHFGGTSIIAREFDVDLTLKTLSDPNLGVTHFFGVPAIYLFLSQHDNFDNTDLSTVKSWGCGGAPMPVALLKKYSDRGIIIQAGFGMTETSPTVFLADKRRALEKPKSVGKPMLHTRVRVVNDNLEDVPVGEVGEVVVAGPNITPGYWNRPDANEKSFSVDADPLATFLVMQA